jgi:hypothetical protein
MEFAPAQGTSFAWRQGLPGGLNGIGDVPWRAGTLETQYGSRFEKNILRGWRESQGLSHKFELTAWHGGSIVRLSCG